MTIGGFPRLSLGPGWPCGRCLPGDVMVGPDCEVGRSPLGRTTTWVRRLPGTGQIAVLGALLVVAAVAWWTIDDRMAGMDAGPGTDPGGLGFYVSAWVAMMAAMMFPSVAPMVSTYAIVDRGRRATQSGVRPGHRCLRRRLPVTWTAFGLLAYGLFELVRSLDIDAFAWDRDGPTWRAR